MTHGVLRHFDLNFSCPTNQLWELICCTPCEQGVSPSRYLSITSLQSSYCLQNIVRFKPRIMPSNIPLISISFRQSLKDIITALGFDGHENINLRNLSRLCVECVGTISRFLSCDIDRKTQLISFHWFLTTFWLHFSLHTRLNIKECGLKLS